MKKSLQMAGAFIGIIVGAGFASGQEILQFFTSFGIWGIIGAVLATALFAFIGMNLTSIGSRLQTTSHKEVVYKVCGKPIGLFVDVLITFFLFGVAVVMFAGAGSIFENQFHIPSIWGSLFMVVLTALTLLLKVDRIIKVISAITPFLVLLVLIIAGYAVFTTDLSISQLDAIAKEQKSASSNWFMGAALYVSYNIAAGAAMLAVMGGAEKDEKIAKWGGIFGGLGLGILILLINVAIFAKIDLIQGTDMPMLVIASQISPFVGFLMSIALLGMIYNTAVGMLYAFTVRIIPAEKPAYKGVIVVVGIASFGVSFIGFIELVSAVYPVTGYLGFVLIAAIIFSWLRFSKATTTIPVLKEE